MLKAETFLISAFVSGVSRATILSGMNLLWSFFMGFWCKYSYLYPAFQGASGGDRGSYGYKEKEVDSPVPSSH